MSAGQNLADVTRTLIVAGTITFLGYLGYTLIRSRTDNPPPQLVTMESEDLEDLRSQLQRVRSDHTGLRRRYDDLERGQERLLLTGIETFGLPPNTKIEYGTLAIRLKKGKNQAGKRLSFRHSYEGAPMVFCSHNGPPGTFLYMGAARFKDNGCRIGIQKAGNWVEDYEARIAYVVIGVGK